MTRRKDPRLVLFGIGIGIAVPCLIAATILEIVAFMNGSDGYVGYIIVLWVVALAAGIPAWLAAQ